MSVEDDKIFLEEKPQGMAKMPVTEKVSRRDMKEMRFEWINPEKPPKYIIKRSKSNVGIFKSAKVDLPSEILRNEKSTNRRKLLYLIRRMFFRSSSNFNLFCLLQCPICTKKIIKMDQKLSCVNGHRFPIVTGVPVLLKEFEEKQIAALNK